LLFAPHITGSPHEILDTVHNVIEAGASAVMFNESFSGGTVRLIRETTKFLKKPPAIYGHNAGIGVKTRSIYRELIDFLARLDGIDFRQTAPVKPGQPFLLPYGQEWEASEEALSRPLPGIKPTMVVRAGGLDQGNIGLNMADVEKRGIIGNVLFLAGSAINSIKNPQGKADPLYGAEAMLQALEIHKEGALKGASMKGASMDEHLLALKNLAETRNLKPLREALRQRYPVECA
jgi:ribulose-bisphosphate carboxylase large chain